jgi:predicted HD phosphohydrolase
MKDASDPRDPTNGGTVIGPQVIAPIRDARLFRELPDRMLAHLRELETTERLPDPFGRVSRLAHCLQSATLAHRAGESEEYVVVALLHDIGDLLGPYNHGEFAAALLAPFIDEANRWMLAHHHAFQGYYYFANLGLDRNMRERYRGHPHFAHTLRFCELYDMPAFNPALDTMPLEAFVPALRRVLLNPRHTVYVPQTLA